VDFVPEYRRVVDESGFLQYELVVIPDYLRIIAGSKFEGNPYSGVEYQPQIRATWSPKQAHSLWFAFSRAVRDPSRSESDLNVTQTIPNPTGLTILRVIGDPHVHSEHLKAYEAGYRFQPSARLSLDLSTYYNDYSELIVLLTSAVQVLPPETTITQAFQNATSAQRGTAQTHGAELSANWQVLRRWRLSPTLTEIRGSSNSISGVPKHLFGMQSRLNLTHAVYLDGGLYHYSSLPPVAGPPVTPGIPTFNRVDLGLLWRPRSQWTLGVWGRNIQSDKHVEFLNDFFAGTAGEVSRAVSFKFMWQSKPESR
jgi:iron complex outermembrane receptor protein